MTWMETIQFFSGCMPRSLGKTLALQAEGSVREIRVRAMRSRSRYSVRG